MGREFASLTPATGAAYAAAGFYPPQDIIGPYLRLRSSRLRSISSPLRGSLGQQPRGAVVSAAMVGPRVGGALRAAVVVRESVPCVAGGGGLVARGSATLPPPTRLLGDAVRFAPAPPLSPPLKSAAGRSSARECNAENSRPAVGWGRKLASGGEFFWREGKALFRDLSLICHKPNFQP